MSQAEDPRTTVNLEQQRKRAKELRRAHREGDVEAAARIARHLPRTRGQAAAEVLATGFTLSEAQLVVAREAGFSSWPVMKRQVEARALGETEVVEALVEAAVAGDEAGVRAVLARDPRAARRSIHAAAALADAESALVLLEADPALADRREGRRAWTPLICVCCVRYRAGDHETQQARVRIARRLLELGADANAVAVEPGFVSGNVTMLDEPLWRPLTGAAGQAASPELVGVLLEAGADPQKTPGLLPNAVRGGNLEVMKRALAARPPWWQVTWALKGAVELDRPEMARLLIPHAVLPMVTQPALSEAIRLERDAALIEILLGEDAKPELERPVRQAAYRLALRHGHHAAADLLRRRGAQAGEVSAADLLIAAAVTEDHVELRRLLGQALPVKSALSADDHRMLSWAIGRGRLRAVPLLLEAGLDPNVADKEGETPLHLAVRAGALPTMEALLGAGAGVDARNFDGQTPLEVALGLREEQTRERLTRRLLDAGASPARLSQFAPPEEGPAALEDELRRAGAIEHEDPDLLFERAADAVAFGDLATLRDLLDDEPALVHARSPRPHRATLLHYCGANGTEDPRQRTPENAPAVAQLLLERGAEVEAECKLYGGGTTTMGLMLTSVFPRRAGLDGELVRVLARAGAKIATVDGEGPMIIAISHGSPLAAAALAEAGVPVDDLFVAAGLNRLDVLDELLSRGADVNARFSMGYTALIAAAGMGNDQAVKLLLEHGADSSLSESRWNDTAAEKARYFDHPGTSELIEQHRRKR